MHSGRLCATLCAFLALTAPARAVIVRGKVTSPLGMPQPGARVQLILGPRSVADAIAGPDGAYELRTDLAGRFVLLTSASVTQRRPAVQISPAFYGGRTDELVIDIALDPSALTPQLSAEPTLRPTPLQQLPVRTTQIFADQLLTRQGIANELQEDVPGTLVLRTGETGTPATLFVRGADTSAIKLSVDGVSAESLGGGFDLSTLGASGLAAIASTPALEVTPGANPLHPEDAEAGLLTLHTAPATALGLRLLLSGDAGPLDTVHDEAVAGYTRSRYDLLAAFARFDTSNSIPASPFHLVTENANLAVGITANTSLRLTLRNDVSASGLPSPFDLFGVQPQGKLAEQNLISGVTYETRTRRDWHTLLRYGLVRERSETFNFLTPATGLPVTITGANGYRASGTATFIPLPAREDRVTDRDEYTLQTNYPFASWLSALLQVRFADERAADLLPATLAATYPSTRVERTHLAFSGGLQGDTRHRVFYQTSGLLDFGNSAAGAANGRTNTLGLRGSPEAGLTWSVLRPGRRRLSGTTLHAVAATGFREPTLAEQNAFPLTRTLPRSRTFSTGIDQNLLHEKLSLRATYFHNQFAHQTELLAPETGTAPAQLSDAQAYRTQGAEIAIHYTPAPRFFVNGGYTYLASLVERSAATPAFNPAFPGIAIGATAALAGTQPFHRPPHSAFLRAEYSGRTLTAAIKGAFVSRSNDSTALVLNPSLLLPNADLSPGYMALDADVNFQVNGHITLYTQLGNLTDNRHIAPIGYTSTPFLIRTGLRIRLGGE